MNDVLKDPTEREYFLTCKTKFFRKSVTEEIKGHAKSYDRTMVLLIPQESDERNRFLSAWLPDNIETYYEIAAYISYPVDSPARLSVHHRDGKSPYHYLFVMSKGVEDILLQVPEYSTVKVHVLPASHDSEADFARETDHDFEVMA
ncbi:MAG: hypothetical protein HC883_00275 [Bdellovibrionaceae bacterium]|nr:hypothetical protein [Pseudobdellovibrionaceae bacterium]